MQKTSNNIHLIKVYLELQNLICSFSFCFSKWKLHRRKDLSSQLDTEKSLPGVSILKPLINSVDPHLFTNLETFFTLDYPKYEILFCIQDDDVDDRLKMYVDSLRNKYPTVQSKVCSFFYILWKKKSTFLPYHVKKNHSTLNVNTFKVMLLLSYYIASLNNKLRT